MECRRSHGHARPLEAYLDQFAELLDDDAALELALEEIHLRRRDGEAVDRAAVSRAIPCHRCRQLDSMLGVESDKKDSKPVAGSAVRPQSPRSGWKDRFRTG